MRERRTSPGCASSMPELDAEVPRLTLYPLGKREARFFVPNRERPSLTGVPYDPDMAVSVSDAIREWLAQRTQKSSPTEVLDSLAGKERPSNSLIYDEKRNLPVYVLDAWLANTNGKASELLFALGQIALSLELGAAKTPLKRRHRRGAEEQETEASPPAELPGQPPRQRLESAPIGDAPAKQDRSSPRARPEKSHPRDRRR